MVINLVDCLVKFSDLSIEEKKRLLDLMSKSLEKPNTGQSKIIGEENEEDGSVEFATFAQCKYLRNLGYKGDPSKLSKKEASAKIKELGGK